jgi:O-antigen/teichoic acid export membrane protein
MTAQLARKLGTDAASNYLRFAVTASIPFLLTPKMLQSFGADGFGLWSLTHSILSLFGLLDLGLSSTLVRFLAGCRTAEKINRLVGTVLTLYLGLSGLGLLVLAGLAFLLAPFKTSQTAFTLIWLLGLRTVTVALPFGVLRSTLYAQQKFVPSNFWQSILSLVYGAAVWMVLAGGAGLNTVAVLMLVFCLVEHAGYFLLLRSAQPGFRLYWGHLERDTLKSIRSFSIASTLSTLAGLILLKTDPIIVALFLPLGAVTSYALSLKIAEGLMMLLKQAVNVLTPQFSRMWSEGRSAEVAGLFLAASRTALLAAWLLGLPILVYTPQVFAVWLGEFHPDTIHTTRILVLAALCSVPQMIASTALTMGGYHNFTARAAALSTILNLVLSVTLVQFQGVVGVALATLASTLIVDLALVTRKAFQLLSIARHRIAKELVRPLLLPLAAQTALLTGASVTSSIFSILTHSALAGVAGLTIYYTQQRRVNL